MPITEVFPNPTVKQVIFQIRFPNLFSIESKIGDFQLKIMRAFPESAVLLKRQILLANVPDGADENLLSSKMDETHALKFWQFKSEFGVVLNVATDSLDITSAHHKTYNLGDGDKFRDVISSTLEDFFSVTSIPFVKRVGLRYVDECPIPVKTNDEFSNWFNTAFPLDRFDISHANEMDFKVQIKTDGCFLRYIESLRISEDANKLIMDFDAYKNDVKSQDCLSVTDKLHELLSAEFERSIKQPLIDYMRTPAGD